MNESSKRDPEAILAKIKQDDRGKLTVFLGAAAGVGKTYAMLLAAHERLAEGVDVAIGWVEAHGRQETETLVQGIPSIKPRKIDYRYKSFEEMDLDAIIEKHPQVVLVDELAHTNIPGSRHPRRYTDVEELLDAGINVYTTLNIQHLESLNDIVAQITGVRVRETIPDQFLENADQIHLIDIPAEELIQRLEEGKVYASDMAAQALRKFFRPGNINALREMALRQAAHSVNQKLEVYRREHDIDDIWPAGEKVLACISSSPFGVHVLRRARRMAANLNAALLVVYVETPRYIPRNQKACESLERNLQLAEKLGAEIISLTGANIAEEVLSIAKQRNVTQIVLGKPLRPRWMEILQGSVVEDVIRGSAGMSVHIIPGEKSPKEQGIKMEPQQEKVILTQYLVVLLQVALITVIGKVFGDNLGLTNIAMLYLLPVLYASSQLGLGPSLTASLAGVLAFDVLFVPPYLRLTVHDARYLITFVVFMVVAITTGTMAQRLRYRIEESSTREKRTRALYNLAKEMAAITDIELLSEKVVDYLAKTMDSEAVMYVTETDNRLKIAAASHPLNDVVVSGNEVAVANWAFKHDQVTGRGTNTLPGAKGIYFPLKSERRMLGVIGVKPGLQFKTSEQWGLLDAIISLVAISVGRLKLAAEAQEMINLEESERLRTALFNSISHDLRTPLSSIIGAVSSLLDDPELYGTEEKNSLLHTIKQGANRMNRVVANLLDIARLESGLLQLNQDWYDIQDIIGVALRQNQELLDDRKIEIEIPPSLPLIKVDFALIEQVLANLLDNAAKYSETGSEISIFVSANESELKVLIADRGQGISPGDEEKIFDKFYRLNSPRRVSGTGLGLSICKAIVEVHGGRIWAQNRDGGGIAITFTVPLSPSIPFRPLLFEAGDLND
ncbi:MAG: ATP-binding protein [Candidatus Saccharibacteria bacterium]